MAMNSMAHDWRNDDTPRRRPMDPTARKRPMDCTARRRPMVTIAGSRTMFTTVRMLPMVIVATRKMRKKNCSDYKQTTKQDNKEINKQATNARLL